MKTNSERKRGKQNVWTKVKKIIKLTSIEFLEEKRMMMNL